MPKPRPSGDQGFGAASSVHRHPKLRASAASTPSRLLPCMASRCEFGQGSRYSSTPAAILPINALIGSVPVEVCPRSRPDPQPNKISSQPGKIKLRDTLTCHSAPNRTGSVNPSEGSEQGLPNKPLNFARKSGVAVSGLHSSNRPDAVIKGRLRLHQLGSTPLIINRLRTVAPVRTGATG